jgi:DNA adenine methylase
VWYMGSKARHAKEIIPFLMKGHDQSRPYVEPFVGGGNLFHLVPAKIKWGNDSNKYAVALLDAIGNKGYQPPAEITKLDYQKIRNLEAFLPPELVGFVGFCCSYGGKFWGGYARHVAGVDNPDQGAKIRNLEKQRPGLKGANFTNLSYQEMSIEDGSTVYCDPPYFGTTKYRSDFDHEAFWLWIRKLSENCRVFVSEYTAPDWAECVWEKTVYNSLTKDTGGKTGVERLFKCHS